MKIIRQLIDGKACLDPSVLVCLAISRIDSRNIGLGGAFKATQQDNRKYSREGKIRGQKR